MILSLLNLLRMHGPNVVCARLPAKARRHGAARRLSASWRFARRLPNESSDQRHVAKLRRRQGERTIKQELAKSREQQVRAADHFGDLHRGVIRPRPPVDKPARHLFARRRSRRNRARRSRAAGRQQASTNSSASPSGTRKRQLHRRCGLVRHRQALGDRCRDRSAPRLPRAARAAAPNRSRREQLHG